MYNNYMSKILNNKTFLIYFLFVTIPLGIFFSIGLYNSHKNLSIAIFFVTLIIDVFIERKYRSLQTKRDLQKDLTSITWGLMIIGSLSIVLILFLLLFILKDFLGVNWLF